MKFDGTSWIYVGNPGFSGAGIWYPSLAFSTSGQPFVAFSDAGNGDKARVMKYDSVYVGINESQKSKLLLYPNPVTMNLNIDIKIGDGNIKFIRVYDIQGKNIIDIQTFKDKITLNTEDYLTGLYIVIVNTDDSYYMAKFCKN
jgi:hypothetical protein